MFKPHFWYHDNLLCLSRQTIISISDLFQAFLKISILLNIESVTVSRLPYWIRHIATFQFSSRLPYWTWCITTSQFSKLNTLVLQYPVSNIWYFRSFSNWIPYIATSKLPYLSFGKTLLATDQQYTSFWLQHSFPKQYPSSQPWILS